MLSLTVFMNIVSELMPITSDAVPLIGKVLKKFYLKQKIYINIMRFSCPKLSFMPLTKSYLKLSF